MYTYEISKYAPGYSLEEWTSISDIEVKDRKMPVSMEEYERVEKAYIDSALAFMEEDGIKTLKITGLEIIDKIPQEYPNGLDLDLQTLKGALKAVLREKFWCLFENEKGFIRVGYDYYMDVRVSSACQMAQLLTRELGLYIRPCPDKL